MVIVFLAAWTAGSVGAPAGTAGSQACGIGSCPERVLLAVSADGPGETVSINAEGDTHDRLLRELEQRKLAIALLSTSQGEYDRQKALIDISQGARQPLSLYAPDPKPLALIKTPPGGGRISGWSDTVRRAQDVSATLRPGLLAQSIPSGAAFVSNTGGRTDAAFAAADSNGSVAEVSIGTAATLVERTRSALGRRSLVVMGLPPGTAGRSVLDRLISGRGNSEMLIFIQLPPTPPETNIEGFAPRRYLRQSDLGLASDLGAKTLTSASTRQPGLVTTIDLAPSILGHLKIAAPKPMRGQTIVVGETRTAEQLDLTRHRWEQLRAGRQLGSIRMIALLVGLVFLIVGTVKGVSRRLGEVTMRALGLSLMWWPVTSLAVAVLTPKGAMIESLLIGGLSVALGSLTDRALPWPRGPVVPVLSGLLFLTADLAFGGRLLVTSVLGPSLASGSRFYGISNELEPMLPVLLLTGIAAVAGTRENILPGAFAAGGIILAFIVGWGRLGADAGGVVTVAAAFATACVASMSGRLNRKRTLMLLLAPVVAVGLLIAVDLLFAGKSHLALNLTRSNGFREIWELFARRYQLALGVLSNAGADVAVVSAAIVAVFVFRNRSTFLPVLGDGYNAALIGGLAGGLAGAFSNDSGPILFVNAVGALLAVVVYLRGIPTQVWKGQRQPSQ